MMNSQRCRCTVGSIVLAAGLLDKQNPARRLIDRCDQEWRPPVFEELKPASPLLVSVTVTAWLVLVALSIGTIMGVVLGAWIGG
jgi:hypothetical protein